METTVPFNRHRTDVFGINLNSHFDWLLGRTAFGAEFRNEDIVSSTLGEPLHHPDGSYVSGLNRSNLSLHLEHNVVLSRLTLSAGILIPDTQKEGGPAATAHGCRPPFFNDRKQAFFDRLRQTDIIFWLRRNCSRSTE